nr:unnamed protein product [Spirometra erinaceieuropaei]
MDCCLRPFEPYAQNCSERQSEEITKSTAQLAAHSEEVWHGSSDEYVAYIKRELSASYCEATVNKINCITTLLRRNCSTDVVHLIQNYFRELLPKGCFYSEEPANASHRKRSQRPDYVASQPLTRPNKKRILDNLALNDDRYVNDAYRQVKTSNAQFMNPHYYFFISISFIFLYT